MPLVLAGLVLLTATLDAQRRPRWPRRSSSTEDSEKPKEGAGISPGPRGLGTDYRVALTWLAEPGDREPGDYGRRFEHQGRGRYYEIHAPKDYDPGRPWPVVLVLHGGSGFATLMRYITGMDAVADEEGFLAVYPAGTSARFDDRLLFWNTGKPMRDKGQESVDDVAYFEFLLDDLAKHFRVDPGRVYATGISNGAMMCYRLAAELPDRICAIAPVTGHTHVDDLPIEPTACVPVMHFAGKHDPLNRYEGGPPKKDVKGAFEPRKIYPVPEAIFSWVKHFGLGEAKEERRVGQAHLTRYADGDCEVALWVLEDGGHSWPGGQSSRMALRVGVGPIHRGIHASHEMWTFFERHARTEDAQGASKESPESRDG